jgi:hypothetical protein
VETEGGVLSLPLDASLRTRFRPSVMTRKLPPVAAFGHALSSVRDNIGMAFRLALPWYAIVVPLTIGLYLVLSLASGGKPEESPILNFWTTLVAGAVALLSASSIATNWHRYILRDEVPRGREILRIDALVLRYFGNMLLIMLAVLAAMTIIAVPLTLPAALVGLPGIGVFLMAVVGLPAAGVLFLRLAVKLPAIALGRTDFHVREAWKASEGNNLAILGLFVLNLMIAVLIIAAVLVLHAIFSLFGPAIGMAVEIGAQVAGNWILTILGITVLTSLYGFLVENRDF